MTTTDKPTNADVNAAMRIATGNVSDDRPLVGFLYDLMRDHLVPGQVEALVCGSETIGASNTCAYTNGHLARYAQLLADRLTGQALAPRREERRPTRSDKYPKQLIPVPLTREGVVDAWDLSVKCLVVDAEGWRAVRSWNRLERVEGDVDKPCLSFDLIYREDCAQPYWTNFAVPLGDPPE